MNREVMSDERNFQLLNVQKKCNITSISVKFTASNLPLKKVWRVIFRIFDFFSRQFFFFWILPFPKNPPPTIPWHHWILYGWEEQREIWQPPQWCPNMVISKTLKNSNVKKVYFFNVFSFFKWILLTGYFYFPQLKNPHFTHTSNVGVYLRDPNSFSLILFRRGELSIRPSLIIFIEP